MKVKPDAYGIRHSMSIEWACFVFNRVRREVRQAVLTTPDNTLVIGDVVDTITWPGLGASSLRERTFRPIPEGGPGVGKNSLAYCVEENFVNGQADFKIWDGQTGEVYHMPAFGTSRRYHIPVPVNGEWLTVQFRINGTEPARLISFPFNLAGTETTLVSTSPDIPADGFWSQFYFADGRMVCPMYGPSDAEPTTCYVFDSIDQSFTVEAWTGSWDYTARDFGGSGEPYGDASWRLKAAKPTVISESGGGSECKAAPDGSFGETRAWPSSQVVEPLNNGATPSWSEFPDASGRILVTGWLEFTSRVWITTREGTPFEELAISTEDGSIPGRIDAAWIAR